MSYTLNTRKSWSATQAELSYEFEKWGIADWDTNYPRGARLEGFNQSEEERTVTLRYKKEGKEVTLSMGKQARAIDNLRVLFLATQSMRLNEKRGIGEVLESAYLQLAAPERFNPFETLGVFESAPIEVCEAAFRALSLKQHPDRGGSSDQMKKLNQAIKMIREQKK